jgi:hypothetical protein
MQRSSFAKYNFMRLLALEKEGAVKNSKVWLQLFFNG